MVSPQLQHPVGETEEERFRGQKRNLSQETLAEERLRPNPR